MSHRQSSVGQRDRSGSPTQRVFSGKDKNVNRDNANNGVGQPLVGNNTGGDSYHNADDAGENLDNETYEFSFDLANITPAQNKSASQNDSDISMAIQKEVVNRWNL
ncbi:8230_t:CDS:1 [Diversispora eburnea]|uniref:8230_t:CDS:1 n=1 Tax=Diversispora eburnea TaxID=1213867 RepID=A0A9N8ZFQ8_9GLOM|nr:8230_t:CDS:1 [Diversispora eburnea]